MVYRQEEMEWMKRVLGAFGDYVASSAQMDVAYSDKTGFVRLITAEDADWVYFPIESGDKMLEMFFFDILCDLSAEALAQNPELTNRELDYSAVARAIRPYLDRLDIDRDYGAAKLEAFIRKWQNQDKLP